MRTWVSDPAGPLTATATDGDSRSKSGDQRRAEPLDALGVDQRDAGRRLGLRPLRLREAVTTIAVGWSTDW